MSAERIPCSSLGVFAVCLWGIHGIWVLGESENARAASGAHAKPTHDSAEHRLGRAYVSGSAASPNGLPSESLQIAHRSPGWTTLPPSASTLSRASATSTTA